MSIGLKFGFFYYINSYNIYVINFNVIFVDTNTHSLESLLSSCFLSERNLNELSRFKLEETKKEKAASLILKNKYVGEYQVNEFGKPISEKCYFNISHCKGVVVFVKDDFPIGIDIEIIRHIEDDLRDYISSKEEKVFIQDDEQFFKIWTNKESLTKCLGTGIKNKISEIPALPITGIKTYQNKTLYSRTIKYQDYVLSITRDNKEPFEIIIQEERL